jgi:hypothetical protein
VARADAIHGHKSTVFPIALPADLHRTLLIETTNKNDQRLKNPLANLLPLAE